MSPGWEPAASFLPRTWVTHTPPPLRVTTGFRWLPYACFLLPAAGRCVLQAGNLPGLDDVLSACLRWKLLVTSCSSRPIWPLPPQGRGQDAGVDVEEKEEGAGGEGAGACPCGGKE